ncbi:MAG: dockerin type I repeat-containing protein [Clostridia bacterium]|nr:dockerin type I repeat-containing protein [Clostridia bacterium]
MNRLLKTAVALCLSLVMLVSVMSCAFAEMFPTAEYPVVVVNGIENNPLVANPDTYDQQVIFPPTDLEITTIVGKILTAAVASMASGEYNEILNYIVGSDLYNDLQYIQLNPDGTSKSANLGVNTYDHAISYYNYGEGTTARTAAGDLGVAMAKKFGGNNVYVFTYDWRINVFENAQKLSAFIKNVKNKSGADMVNLICEGYGANVVLAYLDVYSEGAAVNVNNCVFVNSAAMGTSLIGDLFTGSLFSSSLSVVDQTYPSAFIRYTNDVSDNPATWFAWWLTNYVLNRNWEIQSLCFDISVMMAHVKEPLYDRYLRTLLRNFTGLWALVPVEYYEDAVDFMYYEGEDADRAYNDTQLEKIAAYKDTQYAAAEVLSNIETAGVNVSIVSSWDLQLLPIGDNDYSEDEMFGLSAQSDGLIDTYFSSFGATTIPLNDVGAASRHKQVQFTDKDYMCSVYDHLDPTYKMGAICHYIDASTCALPDSTWFIRNMKYGSYDAESNVCDFLKYLLTGNSDQDIWSSVYYMQYMTYNRYVKPGYLIEPGNLLDPEYLLGDADLNGVVNAADARYILRISARLEDYPDPDSTKFLNCDVNKDGVITAADARITLRVSAGLSTFEEFLRTSDADA